jgi:DNA-directed RNA polymerase specialized sigma24 family protein
MNVGMGGACAPIEFCAVCKRDKAVCGGAKRYPRIGPSCKDAPGVRYAPVCIPDDRSFLKQWFNWVRSKVRKRFKRDHDRIPDATQRVCARFLQKEFTSRWFYKYLHEDLVTRTEAEHMLWDPDGPPVQLKFISDTIISPRVGMNIDPNSLWRVSDVLAYVGFDFERYFYSAQGHTIDSDRMLYLLGHGPGEYWKLQSLWRQDRIIPAELTEHECPRGRPSHVSGGNKAAPKTCPECARGLALLRSKGISLAQSEQCPGWKHPKESVQALNPALTPSMLDAIRKMRWNDSQLCQKPNKNSVSYLRGWQGKNRVFNQPRFIMRPAVPGTEPHGIDAGLLKYADRIIGNEVINEFKQLTRTDDMSRNVHNNGVSPETSDSEVVAYDLDSEEGSQRVICDADAVADFRVVEHRSDIASLLGEAALSAEESDVISAISLLDVTVRDYARNSGIPVQRVHRLHTSALKKLRSATVGTGFADRVMREVCDRHDCSEDQILGTSLVGRSVVARADLFATLYAAGMSEEDMSSHFSYSREKISAAVVRGQKILKNVAL